MTLNKDRAQPFSFHVFALDGLVWLFDDSARTYPCTATPHVYAEAIYSTDEESEGDDYPDPSLFIASTVEKLETPPIELDPEDVGPDVDEREAWDTAREEACANCRI